MPVRVLFVTIIVLLFVLTIIYLFLKSYHIGHINHIHDKEYFTQTYVQVFPTTGYAPLSITFTPIYSNEFADFFIEFGDGDTHVCDKNISFVHTYKKKGTYNGTITFNLKQKFTQKFTINVL